MGLKPRAKFMNEEVWWKYPIGPRDSRSNTGGLEEVMKTGSRFAHIFGKRILKVYLVNQSLNWQQIRHVMGETENVLLVLNCIQLMRFSASDGIQDYWHSVRLGRRFYPAIARCYAYIAAYTVARMSVLRPRVTLNGHICYCKLLGGQLFKIYCTY